MLDTEQLLAQGQTPGERTAEETQMILNHKEAIEFMVSTEGATLGFNRYSITGLHALLSHNLLSVSAASGRLRQMAVGISQSAYTPTALPQLIEEMFHLFLEKAAAIKDPFEQAFFAMVHLPYLQPFDDVNKRVSRLAANLPFVRQNLAPLSFTDLPRDLYLKSLLGVDERFDLSLLKDLFLWAYRKSSSRYALVRQTIGEPDPVKLRYRQPIRDSVQAVIRGKMGKSTAAKHIQTLAKQIGKLDREAFVNAVKAELLSLHQDNFARYWVSPAEFTAWMKVWVARPKMASQKVVAKAAKPVSAKPLKRK